MEFFMFHYTYLITFPQLSKMYIGVRSSACPPEEDREYTSSSNVVIEHITNGQAYIKKIIETYDTRLDAEDGEIALHALFDVATNDCFLNKANALPGGFTVAGTTHPFNGKTYEEIYGVEAMSKRNLRSEALKNRVFSDASRKKMVSNHADVRGHYNPRAIGGTVTRGSETLFQFSHKAELEQWLKQQGMPHRAMMVGGIYPRVHANRNKKFSHFFGIEVSFNPPAQK
jgi:hypothetical protein